MQVFNLFTRWVIYGAVMGCAQIIPGISAGSIALLLCIYPNLIHIASHPKTLFKAPFDDLSRLMALLIGFAFSLILMSHPISWLLTNHTSLSYAAFIGFILGSLPSCRLALDPEHLGYRHYTIMIVVCISAAIAFLYLPGVSDTASASCHSHLRLAVVSLFAGSAMILPGISGSWLLLILGCYPNWVNSIKNIATTPLLIIALSALSGAGLTLYLLSGIFEKHARSVLSGLFGLMIASLVTLYPYLSLSDESDASLILCMLSTAVISYGITHMSKHKRSMT